MLQFRAVLSVIAAFAVSSCGGSSGGTGPTQNNPPPGPGPGPSANASVTVSNNNYSPGQVSVARGGTVTWRWDSCTGNDPYGGGQTCVSHSVTFDDGGPSAPAKEDGSFARTFASAGTFTYYCTSHGRAAMSGSVIVP
jgi:plastocyanin